MNVDGKKIASLFSLTYNWKLAFLSIIILKNSEKGSLGFTSLPKKIMLKNGKENCWTKVISPFVKHSLTPNWKYLLTFQIFPIILDLFFAFHYYLLPVYMLHPSLIALPTPSRIGISCGQELSLP